MTMKKRKLSNTYISLKENVPFVGKFTGITTLTDFNGNELLNKQSGNPMQVAQFETAYKSDEGQDVDGVWLDGGLKGAFSLCKVKPGMVLEITKKGKKPFGDFEVNDYSVFELVEE